MFSMIIRAVLIVPSVLAAPLAQATQLYMSKEAWAEPPFFNLSLKLGFEDISLVSVTGQESPINQNGAFTVYLKRSAFPIKAPHCTSDWLDVKMGETRDTIPETARRQYLDEKNTLYASLRDLVAKKITSINIVLSFEGEIQSKKPFVVVVKPNCEINFNQGLDHYDADVGVPLEKHRHYKYLTSK